MYIALCVTVFFFCYGITIVTTSIGYHRGLAHGAIRLHPVARWLLCNTGMWLTGIDPKGWVIMHRLHHLHSDTVDDPHAPRFSPAKRGGIFGSQLRGYNRMNDGMADGDESILSLGRDLEATWPIRVRMSWIPYIAHALLAALIWYALGWGLALAVFTGLLSHVVQGAIINYFGHAHGSRNFASSDDSRNNHVAAWLCLGEGYQNNHHRYPSSARFSYRKYEVDMGYAVCRVFHALGVLEIVERTLMQRPPLAGASDVAPGV